MLKIRAFDDPDRAQAWPILRDIVVEQETFPYDPAMTEAEARSMRVVAPPGCTLVADSSGQILGTANMYANRPGPGKHIASGSFMVARAARGQGVGRALVEATLAWAVDSGFAGMQFNAVVEGNLAAEKLYADLGFVTVGTVPGAFESPTRGRVGLHVLYRALPSQCGSKVSAHDFGAAPQAIRVRRGVGASTRRTHTCAARGSSHRAHRRHRRSSARVCRPLRPNAVGRVATQPLPSPCC